MPRRPLESLTESMFYVLMAFSKGPKCGIEVSDAILRRTGGRVRLGPATLYTILGKFEKEGYLQEVSVEGRKRTYRITDKGLEAYHAEQVRLRQCLTDAQRLENEEGSVCLNRKPEPSIDFRPVKAGT